ncbi:hypothetical protein VP01_478g3 [Puccinia sorghi]|uniref:Uncharacterized protein n=1 Tax=Puccinia sorghi TaxID=27349 RepID=A0A0L6UPM2_9BASI|nr:hypothetical protein VP01_478g3 [Puccinia sorghi]
MNDFRAPEQPKKTSPFLLLKYFFFLHIFSSHLCWLALGLHFDFCGIQSRLSNIQSLCLLNCQMSHDWIWKCTGFLTNFLDGVLCLKVGVWINNEWKTLTPPYKFLLTILGMLCAFHYQCCHCKDMRNHKWITFGYLVMVHIEDELWWVSHEFLCVSCQECAVQSHLLECQHGTQLIFIVFMDIWKQAEENQVVQAIWEKNIGDIDQTGRSKHLGKEQPNQVKYEINAFSIMCLPHLYLITPLLAHPGGLSHVGFLLSLTEPRPLPAVLLHPASCLTRPALKQSFYLDRNFLNNYIFGYIFMYIIICNNSECFNIFQCGAWDESAPVRVVEQHKTRRSKERLSSTTTSSRYNPTKIDLNSHPLSSQLTSRPILSSRNKSHHHTRHTITNNPSRTSPHHHHSHSLGSHPRRIIIIILTSFKLVVIHSTYRANLTKEEEEEEEEEDEHGKLPSNFLP